MGSEWTAEQVRKQAHLEDLSASNSKTSDMLNDYAAILDKQSSAEPVGSLTISRFHKIDSMVNHDFEYLGDLPDGSYTLYTHPPAQPSGVSDEVLELAWSVLISNCQGENDFPSDQDLLAALEAADKARSSNSV
jgi:hypothetical protein